MKIGQLGEYEFRVPESGGKAGEGCNITSTIQVLKGNCIVKQIRFKMYDPDSRTKAIQKAKDYVKTQQSPAP